MFVWRWFPFEATHVAHRGEYSFFVTKPFFGRGMKLFKRRASDKHRCAPASAHLTCFPFKGPASPRHFTNIFSDRASFRLNAAPSIVLPLTSVKISSRPCSGDRNGASALWQSVSSIVCLVAGHQLLASQVVVPHGGAQGRANSSFSYCGVVKPPHYVGTYSSIKDKTVETERLRHNRPPNVNRSLVMGVLNPVSRLGLPTVGTTGC